MNEAELPGHKDELAVAGNDLLKAISFPLPLGLDKLSAVAEQKKKLDKLRAKFSLLVARHLNNLFIHLVKYLKTHFRILFFRDLD